MRSIRSCSSIYITMLWESDRNDHHVTRLNREDMARASIGCDTSRVTSRYNKGMIEKQKVESNRTNDGWRHAVNLTDSGQLTRFRTNYTYC